MSALPNVINAHTVQHRHPVLLAELITSTDSLINNVREAFLEARDETDVRWIRERAIDALTAIFQHIPVMTGEYALIKLDALQEIEREAIVGHMNAMIRARKWRKALVDRYFGIRAV
jgi:hypothetical protein